MDCLHERHGEKKKKTEKHKKGEDGLKIMYI